MMPRLPGFLFKFIQKQPPQVFILRCGVRKKTEKLYLEISHKIHKENFAKTVSQNISCNLGDC